MIEIKLGGPGGSRRGSLLLFVPGALVMLLAIAILLMPELLALLVAGLLLLVGLILLGAAWQIQRRGRSRSRFDSLFDRLRGPGDG